MMNKASSSTPNPAADEEDEKLRQLSLEWLHRLCKCGHTPYPSNPKRIANYLKEANEKLGLRIKIDTALIGQRLRVTDAEIIQFSRQNSSSSSSSPRIPGDQPAAEGDLELGQQEEVLFIRRELKASDIRDDQNRLSMPCREVNEEILTAEEAEMLREWVSIPAEMVGPNGRKYNVNLKLTKAGKKSCSYAIGKPWNDIKRDNMLREGMVLNIWISRGERGQLCFRLQREE